MPNNYFQFKAFTIQQEKCSMKVCTDACIFGAWVAEKIGNGHLPVANVLDIGAGTGLLSLMLAQKDNNVIIDAAEVEADSYQQAKENFMNSKWNDRLNIFHTDVKNFDPGKKYDLIMSNPPFYENELLSKEKNNNLAKHHEGLTLKDLIEVIKIRLSPGGHFAVLLPNHRVKNFENMAEENGFFLKEKLLIKQTPSHNFFRGVLLFSNNKPDTITNELTIKNKEGNYTVEFKALLEDYYLKL